jgi:hypothetical protein
MVLQNRSTSQNRLPERNSSNGGSHGDSVAVAAVNSSSPYVGTLVALESAHSPNYLKQHFRIAPHMPSPKPGSMVAVEAITDDGQQSCILERVINVWEINPHEDAFSSNLREVIPIRTEYAEEGSSTVIYRVAEIEPLKEALLDDNGLIKEIRDVQTLPRAGAPVYEATEAQIVEALGLADDPERGIHIGVLRGTQIPVVLKRDVIQRHPWRFG